MATYYTVLRTTIWQKVVALLRATTYALGPYAGPWRLDFLEPYALATLPARERMILQSYLIIGLIVR